MTGEMDEPLTPAGRMFTQPEMDQVINCVLGGERPFSYETVRSVVSDSIMIKHPRFCSLLVRDNNGRAHWRKTQVDIDRHIFVHPDPVGVEDDETAVNDFIADLTVSCPLSTDKPLWEIHLLEAHTCVVLRVHHALGDGVSLLSLMLTAGRRIDDPEKVPTIEPVTSSRRNNDHRSEGTGERLGKGLKMLWFTFLYTIEFILRSLWLRDKKTVVTGGAGVELWPRKLATAKFSLDDMKAVKTAVPNSTINDVLFGVISCGLSRYLDNRNRSPKDLPEGLRITGIALVNLRPQQGLQEITELMKKNSATGWGNKFGMMLLPVYFHRNGGDPLQYVRRAKSMIDKKKMSLEAILSYKIGNFIMSLLGPKFASLLNYRIICNTSFTISNIVGPKEEFSLAGCRITYIRTTSSSMAHGITLHMMSYAGKADMQILVAKDLIPDPENLAKCFQDALLEMKEAAVKR